MHAKPGARRPPRPAPRQTPPRSAVAAAEGHAGAWGARKPPEEASSQPPARGSPGGLQEAATQPSLEEQVKRRPGRKKKKRKANSFEKYRRARPSAGAGSGEQDEVPPPSCLWVWPAVGKPALGSGRGCARTLGLVVHTLPVTSTRRRRCSVEAATDSTGSTGSDGRAGLAQNSGAEGVTSTHHDGHLAICINTEALCCTAETDRARR